MAISNSRSALLFILVTICLDSIGLGIIIPSFPALVSETAHVSLTESSKYFGVVMGSYAFMQFLFSPLVGNLSDRFGRRPILLISVFGLGMDYLVMYFAPSLFWLILGRAISGMFGASFTTAAAYIADISSPEKRAQNFGMIGAAFGIGFVIGPAIGGLLSDFGSRAPFMVAACFSLINFIYGLLVLKESLPSDQRRAFEWKRANPLGALLQMGRFAKMKYLFVVTFLMILTNMSVHSSWNYYTMDKFHWTVKDVGISLAVIGVFFGVVQGGLSGLLVKRLGEKGAATFGFLSLLLMFLILIVLPDNMGWVLYLGMLPYALSGIVDPAIRSVISRKTAMNEQGELQGVFTSLMSLGEILGPPLFMWLYYSARKTAPNESWSFSAPFMLAGLFAIAGLVLVRWVLKDYKRDSDTAEESTLSDQV